MADLVLVLINLYKVCPLLLYSTLNTRDLIQSATGLQLIVYKCETLY